MGTMRVFGEPGSGVVVRKLEDGRYRLWREDNEGHGWITRADSFLGAWDNVLKHKFFGSFMGWTEE